jgi:hypothetical protein
MLWLYCKAVGRHWWALLSCALFTGLGVYILCAHKSNEWAVKATFALAALCLLIACFLAWRDQYRLTEASNAEIAGLNEKYFDERPRVALTVRSPRTGEEWHQLNDVIPPPIFKLEHYGGRTARFVKVDPLSSSRGMFTMKFDEAAILGASSGRQLHLLTFTIYQNGASDLSRDPRILPIMQSADMLISFLRDHATEEKHGTYAMTIRYRDQDNLEEYAEEFILKCEYQGMLLSLEPKPRR